MNHRNKSIETQRLKSIVKEAVSEELRAEQEAIRSKMSEPRRATPPPAPTAAEQEAIRSKMSEEADKFFDLVDQALRLLREAHAMKKSFYIFDLEEIINKLEDLADGDLHGWRRSLVSKRSSTSWKFPGRRPASGEAAPGAPSRSSTSWKFPGRH